MIKMNATQVAQIIEGKLSGEATLQNETEFKFDSREIQAGDVFLALLGEHADGHDFVNQALQNGAVLSIVSKSVTGPHILVPDVIAAIGKLAKFVRDSLPELKVIGITGSQGKTTTKDMLHSILNGKGETVAAKGSFNNDLGVPLTLLRAKPSTRFCIVEMGARHGGDISALAKIANPNVGAVLKVGNAHIGEFGSRENIAKAKGELINSLQPGTYAVLGTYDEFTPRMSFAGGVKKITFGESHDCDVRAADIEFRGGYAHFDLVTPEGREPVALRVMGLHQIPNALAAAAISHVLDISTPSIAAALSEHEANSKWRMEIHDLNEVLLINDSYNANPESMEAALRTLVLLTQERGGRSWAFLGTMHELGSNSAQMHKRIGHLAGELGIDHLISIANQDYLDGLTETQTHTHYFGSVAEANTLETEFEAGDVVLVKASRAEHLEELANSFIEARQANRQANREEGTTK